MMYQLRNVYLGEAAIHNLNPIKKATPKRWAEIAVKTSDDTYHYKVIIGNGYYCTEEQLQSQVDIKIRKLKRYGDVQKIDVKYFCENT